MTGFEWQGQERTRLQDPMSIGEIMEEMMRKREDRLAADARGRL